MVSGIHLNFVEVYIIGVGDVGVVADFGGEGVGSRCHRTESGIDRLWNGIVGFATVTNGDLDIVLPSISGCIPRCRKERIVEVVAVVAQTDVVVAGFCGGKFKIGIERPHLAGCGNVIGKCQFRSRFVENPQDRI